MLPNLVVQHRILFYLLFPSLFLFLNTGANGIDTFLRYEIYSFELLRRTTRSRRIIIQLSIPNLIHFVDFLFIKLIKAIQIIAGFLLTLEPLLTVQFSLLTFANILLYQLLVLLPVHFTTLFFLGFLTRYLILQIEAHLDLFNPFLAFSLFLFLSVELGVVDLHLVPDRDWLDITGEATVESLRRWLMVLIET